MVDLLTIAKYTQIIGAIAMIVAIVTSIWSLLLQKKRSYQTESENY